MRLRFYLKSLNVYLRHKLGFSIPFILIIEITRKCNLKCSYCRRIELSKKEEMSTKELFCLISDAAKIGIPWVTISGGEPLIRKDIGVIGKKIKEKGMIANLNTNGTLITKKNAKLLVDSFDFIKVSFNSDNPNVMRKVMNGVNNLHSLKKGSKVKIGLSFVIDEQTLNRVGNSIGEFKKKVDFITFQPRHDKVTKKVYYNSRFAAKWQNLAKDKTVNDPYFFVSTYGKKNLCDAGELYIYVHPNGKVFGCPKTRLYLGNLKKSSLKTIIKNKQDLRFKRETCKGCFLKCTQEVSSIFNASIIELIKNFKYLIRGY